MNKKLLAVIAIFVFLGVMSREVRAAEIEQLLAEMTFEKETQGWLPNDFCRLTRENAALVIHSQGGLPSLYRYMNEIGGNIQVALKIRTQTESRLQVFWTTKGSPRRNDDQSANLDLQHDGDWHDYTISFDVADVLTSMSLEFTGVEGQWEIQSIRLTRSRAHPLQLDDVALEDYVASNGETQKRLRYTIRNDLPGALTVYGDHIRDKKTEIPGGGTLDFAVGITKQTCLTSVNLTLTPDGFPSISFPFFLYDENIETEKWLKFSWGLPDQNLSLEITQDAKLARIQRNDETVAIMAPLVHRAGIIPQMKCRETVSANDSEKTSHSLYFEGEDVALEIEVGATSLRFSIDNQLAANQRAESAGSHHTALEIAALEGPVVRLFGTLKSGLLPGVEFLGPGDASSSEIDLAKPFAERSKPNPQWITMPLAVLETEKGAISMTWKDATLQPCFSTPNRFDFSDDHRMSLSGQKIEATLQWYEPTMDSDAEPIVFHALRDYVAQHPFPEPPAALRTLAEQKALSLRGLTQSLQAPNGAAWGYAHEEEWPRKPFADFLSTIVRLTDQIPDVVPDGATVTPGGSVIANDAIYFLTENAEQWRKTREQAARNSLALQNPDGSFFYRTRFPDVESAMTSTGYTAITALEIMEYIHVTGNQELFQQLKPTLDFLSHASFPRGGFYHDSPLHTPDLLTAASMVWLHVWAYELTNEKPYLEQAKRFALAGLPFVYLQNAPGGTHENRLYLTIPKWGGTNRHAPVDFGVTNTNTGITFAYALHLLAPHDPETNWNLVARGILHAVERIQHTTGPAVGCVPEKFDVVLQKPLSWNVNPCGLVSLRNALDGNLNGLYVLETPFGRYASPYPLQSTVSGVDVRSAPENKPFQILRNGYKVIQATGPGPVSID